MTEISQSLNLEIQPLSNLNQHIGRNDPFFKNRNHWGVLNLGAIFLSIIGGSSESPLVAALAFFPKTLGGDGDLRKSFLCNSMNAVFSGGDTMSWWG